MMKIAFVQPFSLADANGGARILRGLVEQAPCPVVSCNTALVPPVRGPFRDEVHLPFRPHWGRIERTRFAWVPSLLDAGWLRRWQPRLRRFLEERQVTHLHAVPHAGLDYAGVLACAQALSLPVAVSVHDHPAYCFHGQAGQAEKLRQTGRLWREASHRFVISAPMGEAMNRLFGERDFSLVTDGVAGVPLPPAVPEAAVLRLYFMGLFHQTYLPNLQCLLQALGEWLRGRPGQRVRLTFRCASLPAVKLPPGVQLEVLPFASEAQVREDMAAADWLYLPLPFDAVSRDFVAYSLSTKMVTYLGSGRPVFYHGPADAAAGKLLAEHGAALQAAALTPSEVVALLDRLTPQLAAAVVEAALALARSQFDSQAIHRRFWGTLLKEV